jgi:Concanavalin A-like lectin/glucanases superfamily
VAYFLHGTRMAMGQTNGTLKQAYFVRGDNSFTFPSGTNTVTALLWYRFSETSGTTVTNSGTAGTTANGTLTGGPTLNVAGPRAPTNPGFAANNTGVSFDGINDYVSTSYQLPSSLPTFSLAFWYNPPSVMNDRDKIVGVQSLLYLSLRNSRIRMQAEAPGIRIVDYNYNSKLYIDGTLADSTAVTVANYSSSGGSTFRIGGNIDSDYQLLQMDEVLFYNRVLSDAEVTQLYSGTIP